MMATSNIKQLMRPNRKVFVQSTDFECVALNFEFVQQAIYDEMKYVQDRKAESAVGPPKESSDSS